MLKVNVCISLKGSCKIVLAAAVLMEMTKPCKGLEDTLSDVHSVY